MCMWFLEFLDNAFPPLNPHVCPGLRCGVLTNIVVKLLNLPRRNPHT